MGDDHGQRAQATDPVEHGDPWLARGRGRGCRHGWIPSWVPCPDQFLLDHPGGHLLNCAQGMATCGVELTTSHLARKGLPCAPSDFAECDRPVSRCDQRPEWTIARSYLGNAWSGT